LPVLPASRHFGDNETTIEQLKARIAKAVDFIKSVDATKIDAAADREITFPLGPVNKGQMKGDDYLNHFVLPNFYFHCTAAYAILRHCGVEVGKADYLGAIPMRMVGRCAGKHDLARNDIQFAVPFGPQSRHWRGLKSLAVFGLLRLRQQANAASIHHPCARLRRGAYLTCKVAI
jgi:Domain of unknown function (DUF1993)